MSNQILHWTNGSGAPGKFEIEFSSKRKYPSPFRGLEVEKFVSFGVGCFQRMTEAKLFPYITHVRTIPVEIRIIKMV